MTSVCRYFLQGNCNYGSQCRFLHPGQTTRGGNGATSGSGQAGESRPKADKYVEQKINSLAALGHDRDPSRHGCGYTTTATASSASRIRTRTHNSSLLLLLPSPLPPLLPSSSSPSSSSRKHRL